jgi:hypothetical protein
MLKLSFLILLEHLWCFILMLGLITTRLKTHRVKDKREIKEIKFKYENFNGNSAFHYSAYTIVTIQELTHCIYIT